MCSYTPIGIEVISYVVTGKKPQKGGAPLRKLLSEPHPPSQATFRRLEDTVATFLTSNRDYIGFPKSISVSSVSLLQRTVDRFNLTLAVGFRDTELKKPSGFVLYRGTTPSPPSHFRLAHYVATVSRHASRPKEYCVPSSLGSFCSNYLNLVEEEILSERVADWGVYACKAILSFLPSPTKSNQLRGYSDDFMTMLLLRCVDIRSVKDAALTESLENLPKSLNPSLFRFEKNWAFALFGPRPAAYWWHQIRRSPLISQPLAPELQGAKDSISKIFADSNELTDMLVAGYAKNQKLGFHQDKELKKWLGSFEDVILFFAGTPRLLAFRPVGRRHGKSRDLVKFLCSSSNVIRIHPLANELFLHSKMPSDSPLYSYTFTIRKAIPLEECQLCYPHIYKNIIKNLN